MTANTQKLIQYIKGLQKPLFSRTLLKIVYKIELINYLKNGTLLNKPNRYKDSLGIKRDKINDPSINIS